MKRGKSTKDKIKDLIFLFRSEKINSTELKELHSILDKKNDPDLEKYMNEEWKNTSGRNTSFNSYEQFTTLREKIGIPENNVIPEKEDLAPINTFSFVKYPIFKYAAVLVFGLLIGLLVYNRIVHNEYKTAALKPTTVSVEKGSKSSIILPDGTKVRLNSDSKISYNYDFGKKSRTVKLYGEGFFEVTKNPEKPFFVQTEQITVKVLGTSFNVRSYGDEDITETTLVTGYVEILSNQSKSKLVKNNENKVIAKLSPNQKFRISKSGEKGTTLVKDEPVNTNQLIRAKVPNAIILDRVNLETDISWHNNILVFNNKPFSDIAKILERWYNVTITIEYKALNEIRFSGKFDKESVEDILTALTLIESFNYTVKKDQIKILK